MKSICWMICVSLLLVSGCTKVNAPADVNAIKKSVDDYFSALNDHNAGAVAALLTEKTVWNDLNISPVVGKDAIKKMHQDLFSLFSFHMSSSVADVQVSGNLGTARGTWTRKLTPKAEGLATITDRGSFMITLARQPDRSWKWDSVIANSDQPLPGATADGAEEKALVQIEQDWAQALQKSDPATLQKCTAKEWTLVADGKVTSRAQTLADFRSRALKIESIQLTDLRPRVFGDVALVTMTVNMKGKYRGANLPGPVRSTDFFVKRDGRWQAISTQNITIR